MPEKWQSSAQTQGAWKKHKHWNWQGEEGADLKRQKCWQKEPDTEERGREQMSGNRAEEQGWQTAGDRELGQTECGREKKLEQSAQEVQRQTEPEPGLKQEGRGPEQDSPDTEKNEGQTDTVDKGRKERDPYDRDARGEADSDAEVQSWLDEAAWMQSRTKNGHLVWFHIDMQESLWQKPTAAELAEQKTKGEIVVEAAKGAALAGRVGVSEQEVKDQCAVLQGVATRRELRQNQRRQKLLGICDAIYDAVGDFYHSEEALGRTASQAMLCLSARASHREFPMRPVYPGRFLSALLGDWNQVAPSELHALSGRVYFGALVILEEACHFLKMVGLIPARNGEGGDSSGSPGDAASEFNKLMQTGHASMTAKSAGAFGQDVSQTVSIGIGGNGRPAIVVPMLRGTLGIDAVATDPAVAARVLRAAPARETQADSEAEGDADAEFEPDYRGYSVRLVDGRATRLQAANRGVPVKEGVDLKSMAARVLTHLSQPRAVVPWSGAARLTFKGLQAVRDAQCAVLRGGRRQGNAAMYGASPWLLGMIAVALVVLEIAVGEWVCGARDAIKDPASGRMNATAFWLRRWKAVVRAGLGKCQIGRCDDGVGAAERPGAPRIHAALPAVGDGPSKATGCHNRLMMLCEVALQTHSGAIEARGGRERKMGDRGSAGGAVPSRAMISAACGAGGGAPAGAAGFGQQRAAPSEQPRHLSYRSAAAALAQGHAALSAYVAGSACCVLFAALVRLICGGAPGPETGRHTPAKAPPAAPGPGAASADCPRPPPATGPAVPPPSLAYASTTATSAAVSASPDRSPLASTPDSLQEIKDRLLQEARARAARHELQSRAGAGGSDAGGPPGGGGPASAASNPPRSPSQDSAASLATSLMSLPRQVPPPAGGLLPGSPPRAGGGEALEGELARVVRQMEVHRRQIQAHQLQLTALERRHAEIVSALSAQGLGGRSSPGSAAGQEYGQSDREPSPLPGAQADGSSYDFRLAMEAAAARLGLRASSLRGSRPASEVSGFSANSAPPAVQRWSGGDAGLRMPGSPAGSAWSGGGAAALRGPGPRRSVAHETSSGPVAPPLAALRPPRPRGAEPARPLAAAAVWERGVGTLLALAVPGLRTPCAGSRSLATASGLSSGALRARAGGEHGIGTGGLLSLTMPLLGSLRPSNGMCRQQPFCLCRGSECEDEACCSLPHRVRSSGVALGKMGCKFRQAHALHYRRSSGLTSCSTCGKSCTTGLRQFVKAKFGASQILSRRPWCDPECFDARGTPGPGIALDEGVDGCGRSYAVAAGVLRRAGSEVSVENLRKRYLPRPGDLVVGTVLQRMGEVYKVDVRAPSPAWLPANAFNAATRRNRPLLEAGALVHARVETAHPDLDTELSCVDPDTKKSWTTGEVVLGPLQGGLVFEVAPSAAGRLLAEDCFVLDRLGREFAYEICVGQNGRAWLSAPTAREAVLLLQAIKRSFGMTDVQVEAMVTKIVQISS
ncbi:unnamed protein product [Prorocentrum cordatum]|uniref:K Homology domain-containing protein n=1 Tax=Prorocentrum cordatum TaxID=2364126 RepID=A0ABN9SIQ8_9DINO|nr:unnamed protein product [Polarella glacialis]